jgi:hypothetical protein
MNVAFTTQFTTQKWSFANEAGTVRLIILNKKK